MPKLAFENLTGESFSLTETWIEKGLKASKESPRKRMILPIHRRQDAEVQRMINFLQPGTYIRPHRHPLSHATESIVMLKGTIRFFIFDETGNIMDSVVLNASPIPGMMDMEPGIWHSFLVEKPDTILFECKKGPYHPESDKEFANWAPAEQSAGVEKWMGQLKKSSI